MDSLESVLNDGDAEVAEVVAEVPEVEEAPETPPEAEPETGEKEEEAPPAPEPDKEVQTVPIAALKAEREKRQALERERDERNAKPAEPAPDIFDDQKGYTDHMAAQFKSDLFNERANTSEFHARREFKNLDGDIEAFQLLQADNPALTAQVQNAASPYHEIHDIVARHEKLAKMENVEEWEASTRAEIEANVRAEIKAEMEGKVKADKDLRDAIPTSLVGESSKGSVQQPDWEGPSTLSDILGD